MANYTGTVDAISITKTGLYKLDVYGAGGAGLAGTGGGCKGGHSVGYTLLQKGTTIYACIGGAGVVADKKTAQGGYNGGGLGCPWLFNNGAAATGSAYSGGGASHIAVISGTLVQIGASRKNQILIVGEVMQ